MRPLCAALSLVVGTVACTRAADEEPRQIESVDEIVAAAPDNAMKERWRQAEAKGQLPPLDSLPPVGPPVTQRTQAQVTESQKPVARPAIQDAVVGTVQPFSTAPIDQYAGPFTVTGTTATSVTGVLAGRGEPLELHFKLPDAARLSPVAVKTQHRLRLRDDVENQSQRREIFLSTADRAPVLVLVSDGGMRPYTRRFEEIPLTVTQLPPGNDGVSRVTVSLAGSSATLRPGDRGQLTVGGAPLSVFLESSYWTSPERVETAEGDAYHVVLMLYRRSPT